MFSETQVAVGNAFHFFLVSRTHCSQLGVGSLAHCGVHDSVFDGQMESNKLSQVCHSLGDGLSVGLYTFTRQRTQLINALENVHMLVLEAIDIHISVL